MKILVLAPNVPATSRMPGSPRLFSLSRELARAHQLVLMTFCSSPDRYDALVGDPECRNVFGQITVLPEPPPATWWAQQRHRIHLAAHFDTRFRHAEYHASLRRLIGELHERERFDVIYVDSLRMAQYVTDARLAPTIVDLHDSLTLLAQSTLRAERGARNRLSAYVGLVGVRRLERSLARSFDLLITNSPVDEAVIRRLSGTSNTLTIGNGVDTEYFAPESRAVQPDKLVFTGVMGYAPNEDAALYFSREIFPLVRARRPQAEFWVVGDEPSPRVRELATLAGIHVTGGVPDVRPFVQSAALFVCPLRVGAGVKNKILAALAMRKAIVATSLSVQGLDLAHGQDLSLADDPGTFGDRVVHLLEHQDEARRLAENGWLRVRERYAWSAMGRTLETAIGKVLEAGKTRASQ